MARTLETSAIVGCGDIINEINDGDLIAMNGETYEKASEIASKLLKNGCL